MSAIKCSLLLSFVTAALLAYWLQDTFRTESLSGARVLLTGASTGIGEEMAYHYCRFGAEVILTARTEDLLDKVTEKCRQLGAKKVHYIPADMSKPEDPVKVVEFALEKLGGLDYLVLNHIGGSPYKMWNGDVEHMKWLMQVNFFSYVQLTTVAIPVLSENNGSIVVVSSLLGKIPNPFVTSYAASKFALEGFFGSLRHEIAMQRQDVSITLCILGLIDTKSAMDKIRGMVSLNAYPASESALAIIKGAARRERDVFYPWWTRLLCCIKEWFPEYQDRIIRNTYNYTIKEEN